LDENAREPGPRTARAFAIGRDVREDLDKRVLDGPSVGLIRVAAEILIGDASGRRGRMDRHEAPEPLTLPRPMSPGVPNPDRGFQSAIRESSEDRCGDGAGAAAVSGWAGVQQVDVGPSRRRSGRSGRRSHITIS